MEGAYELLLIDQVKPHQENESLEILNSALFAAVPALQVREQSCRFGPREILGPHLIYVYSYHIHIDDTISNSLFFFKLELDI